MRGSSSEARTSRIAFARATPSISGICMSRIATSNASPRWIQDSASVGGAAPDGETQGGAAELAGRRGIELAERLEQPVEPVGRDPEPGVADRELELDERPPTVARRAARADGDADLAGVGELDRIVEQVHEDLAKAGDVADDGVGDRFVHAAGQLEPLLGGPDGDQVEGRFDAFAEVERLALELHAA